MAESAIIVKLAIPRRIEAVRRANVPGARLGVPAHVTILYPFVGPRELTTGVRADLAAIAREIRAFDVRFAEVSRWPGLLYLEPAPRAPFAALIERVAARFPEHPPYAGAIDEVIPHLTIAEDVGDAARLDTLAATVRPHLPFQTLAIGLDVIAHDGDQRWRRRWRLPFSS